MEQRETRVAAVATPLLVRMGEHGLVKPASSLSGPHATLEAAVWLVCVFATIFAAFLIRRFAVGIDYASLLAAIAVLGFLLAVYIAYGRWRASPRLSNLCGVLAAMTWSGAMAGIISLIGLRYHAPMIDAQLAHWDRAAGIDVPAIIAWAADYPFWSSLLAIAYESSFPLLFGLIVLLAFTRRFDRLWVLAFVFALTIVVSTSISVVWPARGAFAFFDYPASLLERLPRGAGIYHLEKFDYFSSDPSPVVSFASLQGVVTFPSFHCCLALMTIFATWGLRWFFPISLSWNGLVIMSTVPIGGHYAIDLPGGALLWLAATATGIAMASLPPIRWHCSVYALPDRPCDHRPKLDEPGFTGLR
jgi:PAP2 superfamily